MRDKTLARTSVKQSDESYFINSVLEAGNLAVWHWNMDSGDIQVAGNFAAITQVSRKALTHITSLLDLIVPDDRELFSRAIEESLHSGEGFSCDVNLLDDKKFVGDRKTRGVCFNGRSYRDGGAERVACGVVAKRQAPTPESEPIGKDHLRDQNHLLYSILNNTNSAITAKCVKGRYLLANQEFCRLIGKNESEIYGKTDLDLFDQQRAREIRQFDALTLKRNRLFQLEESMTFGATDSTYLSVRFPIGDNTGKVHAIGLVATDISNRKIIEQTIEQQRRELRVLLDSMRSCIWYLDDQGTVKSCNRLANQWFRDGYSVGKNFLELSKGWDDPPLRQREILQVARTGVAQLGSVERCQRGDGQERWLNVDKIPINNSAGEITGTLLVVNDITESVLREKALLESEARYRAFISNSAEAIWRYDIEPPVDTTLPKAEQVGQITERARLAECNEVMARMCGYRNAQQALGQSIHGSGSQSYRLDLEAFIDRSYRLTDWEFVCLGHRGEQLYMQMSAIGIVEEGRLMRVWGVTRDTTLRSRYLAKLEHQANHDSLTQLPNRNFLYREMGRLFSVTDSGEAEGRCALLLIDLNRFKEINDTLGHHAGDELLKQVGRRLKAELDELPGTVVRLGGDEFAVFLSSIGSYKQAEVVGYRVLDAIRKEFNLDGFYTEVSASIGISIYPDQARDLSTMMRYADVAMYRAKRQMQGVCIYSPEIDPHSPKRLALMGDLGRAIRRDQLTLQYQPKVDLKQRRVFGVEALLRWNHPQLGFVPPGEFIPLAEMTDLIQPMTLWVLENSIRQCAAWQAQGLKFSVAVNLSARNLLDEMIADQIATLLNKYALLPSALELEITESMIMVDPVRALRVLGQLHKLGVQLSIDDFGTGYSSLAYLKRLPVQALKIDYSFVVNMLEDEQDAIIVNSTINLAHNLGLKVVAEGVESQAILDILRGMDCDQAQGYYIGRPMTVAGIGEWLGRGRWCNPMPNA